MKSMFSRKLSAFLLCTGLTAVLPLPVAAIDTDSLSEAPDILVEWPDIRDVALPAEPTASPDNTGAESVLFWNMPLSGNDLTEFLTHFPFSLDSGSFFMNQMHGFPIQMTSQQMPEIQYWNGQLITRGSWQALEKEISDRLEEYQGDWSVYIKNLENGKTISINEHSMESASLIKLYIAGATYELIEQGVLEETDTIKNALSQMIVVSDNESSNVLVRAMYDEGGEFQEGLAVVNDFIRRYGFTNTEQVNGIADPSLWVTDGRVNMTSTADCGKLLEMIYNRELVSHFSSFRFEVLLNKQEVNYKIPAGLPEDVHISHKTGEVDDTENDAAIIYTPYGDYIFCIMSTQLTDTNSAVDQIREITRLVYDYFVTDAVISDVDILFSLNNNYADPESAVAEVPEAESLVTMQAPNR